MKLKKGDKIEEITLPSIDGTTFNFEAIKGKKAMVSFYRYSSCPFCHLRTVSYTHLTLPTNREV